MSWIGPLIGGLGSLAGGFFNNQANKAAQAQQAWMYAQNAENSERWANFNFQENQRQFEVGRELAMQNMAMQEQFARMGIQWRAQDAQQAGIHPLAALGNPGISFSPVSVGATGGADYSAPGIPTPVVNDAWGNAFKDFGQNIGRAVEAAQQDYQRDIEHKQKMQKVTLAKTKAEADLVKSQAAVTRSQMPPPIPRADSNPSGNTEFPNQYSLNQAIQDNAVKVVEVKPSEVIPHVGGAEAGGPTAGYKWYRLGPDRLILAPGEKLAESMENSIVQNAANNVLQVLDPAPAPEGYKHDFGQIYYRDYDYYKQYGDKGFHNRPRTLRDVPAYIRDRYYNRPYGR